MPCLAGSITSFPLKLNGPQTFYDIRNNLTLENINLIFKWGSSFSYPSIQLLNESSTEITHNSFISTNLVYNYLNYKLINVQITKANFTEWISSGGANAYDVVLTFIHEPINGLNYDKSPQIILLVNPIITSASIDNEFLKSLAGFDIQPSGAISQRNISAEKLFENNSANNYAYYTTCIDTTDSFGNFQNLLVVVNTGSTLLAQNTTINRIKSIIESKVITGIRNYIPLYYNLSIIPYSITNPDDFKQKVKLSNGYITNTEYVYQDNTDAYKCVPINPENDIDGTKIKKENATSLKSVLDERDKEKKEYNDVFVERMTGLKQVVIWILVSIFGIIILYIIIYFIRIYVFSNDSLTFNSESKILSGMITAFILSIIGSVLGFLIGFGIWKIPSG
jgi:hypothetical protein